MSFSSLNVCEALDIIECEITSQFSKPNVPLLNLIGLKDTLLPSVIFLNGMKMPSVKKSITTIGIGYAHSFLSKDRHRVYGLLQRCGVAGLLVNLNGDSVIGPILSILIWHLVSIYGAQDSKYPFKKPSTTGQTWLDRQVVGSKHMLNPDYDPDGILTTIMTSASMWFGQWCAHNALSINERSVLGLSLVSLGYMCCYAFPQKYPFSQRFWTFSYALGTSGYSLLKWTVTDLASDALSRHSFGNKIVGALNMLGSHTIELYIISNILDQSGITRRIRSMAKGWRGKALTAISKSVILFASACVLNAVL